MTTVVTAHSMSYSTAHEEALFLSDKMAYELGLTEAQYEAVYRINLDYLMHISSHRDLRGHWWEARNRHLRQVLNRMQYGRYIGISYFHHPLTWHSGRWVLPVRAHYAHGRMLRHHPHPTPPSHTRQLRTGMDGAFPALPSGMEHLELARRSECQFRSIGICFLWQTRPPWHGLRA